MKCAMGQYGQRGAAIKESADQVLKELSPTLRAMYDQVGRSSIPPERLFKAQVLIRHIDA